MRRLTRRSNLVRMPKCLHSGCFMAWFIPATLHGKTTLRRHMSPAFDFVESDRKRIYHDVTDIATPKEVEGLTSAD